MSNIKLFLILVFLSASYSMLGQETIDTIHIFDTKPIALTQSNDHLESNDSINNNITDFLQLIESGQLQTVTPGGITSFLYRGMGNRHLPILWNGVNIQSITNGSFDISLIPSQLFDGSGFYKFGSPALLGNNSMAGALNLSKNVDHKSLFASINYSSLQNYGVTLKTNFVNKKWSHHLGVDFKNDQNIFNYSYNNQSQKRTSTDFNNLNLTYKANYYFDHNKLLNLDVWWQNSDRFIPTSVTASNTIQTQKDKNFRTHLRYQQIFKKYTLVSSLTMLKENLDFLTTGVDSRSKVNSYIGSVEWYKTKNREQYFLLRWRLDDANPNFYSKQYQRNTLNLAYSRVFTLSDYIKLEPSIRQDIVDNKLMPIAFSIKASHRDIQLSLARNYNLPGFNDLYWPLGGDPSLKTERASQADLHFNKSINNHIFDVHLYASLVDDWIQWTPRNSGIWYASNQKQVLSRGIDFKMSKKLSVKNINLFLQLGYGLNFTTATKHYFQPELIGKQLIYVPKHKLNFQFRISRNNHSLLIESLFTGLRPDSPDNVFKLDGYNLLNVVYGFRKNSWMWSLHLNNITNQNYSLVRFFPMPGINGSLKFTFSI